MRRCLHEHGRLAGQVLAVEADLWDQLANDGLRFTLTGRIDRVELQPDGLLGLLDDKARPGGMVIAPEALAQDLGMFVYFILARLRYPAHPRVRLTQLNLISLAQTVIDYTDEQRATNKARLVAAVADIHGGRFEARPGPDCDGCPVRDRCPAYQPDAGWDEL